jgi:hypothetical protein
VVHHSYQHQRRHDDDFLKWNQSLPRIRL